MFSHLSYLISFHFTVTRYHTVIYHFAILEFIYRCVTCNLAQFPNLMRAFNSFSVFFYCLLFYLSDFLIYSTFLGYYIIFCVIVSITLLQFISCSLICDQFMPFLNLFLFYKFSFLYFFSFWFEYMSFSFLMHNIMFYFFFSFRLSLDLLCFLLYSVPCISISLGSVLFFFS